jgi:Cft2 family RNA processing exonuclease
MAAQDADIKIVRGISKMFIVDGFQFQTTSCNAYFLTHYHSDHTVGLNPTFNGPALIYTSPITASLLIGDKGVDRRWVVALSLNTTTLVDGVEVTPLDANHCPGAVMFHFREKLITTLHVGDFRAERCVCEDENLLSRLRGGLDFLYLDTTYCSPSHHFPPQAEVGLDSICSSF